MNQSEFEKVKAHPFHHYLGIKDIQANEGHAEIEVTVAENTVNPAGTFHGGVIYTISDICAFCALISTLEEGQIGVTNSINIQVMRAVKKGDIVTFKAQLIKSGKRLAFLETNVYCQEKLIAKANITKTLLL